MITDTDIADHLRRHPLPELAGKTIGADVFAAYLFLAHHHHDDESFCPAGGNPYVDSLALEAFIRDHR